MSEQIYPRELASFSSMQSSSDGVQEALGWFPCPSLCFQGGLDSKYPCRLGKGKGVIYHPTHIPSVPMRARPNVGRSRSSRGQDKQGSCSHGAYILVW